MQKQADIATTVPWPAAIAIGLVGYLLIRYGLRWFPGDTNLSLGDSIRQIAADQGYAQLSWGVLASCWLIAVGSFLQRNRRLTRARVRERAEQLSLVPSPAFGRIVQDAFRQQGFTLTENRRMASRAHVDLVLRKGSRTTLVHCLPTPEASVDEPLVRELLDQRKRHGAAAVYIVTMGENEPEARRRIRGRPIELIAGTRLLELARPRVRETSEPASFIDSPLALLGTMAGAILLIATMQYSGEHGSRLSPIPDNLVALLPYDPVAPHAVAPHALGAAAGSDTGTTSASQDNHATRAMAIIDPTAADDP